MPAIPLLILSSPIKLVAAAIIMHKEELMFMALTQFQICYNRMMQYQLF